MSSSSKQFPPVAIVLGGTFANEHYEIMVETLTAVFAQRKIPVRTFDNPPEALGFLDEQRTTGDWKGALVFLSGSRMIEADEIASTHEDIRVTVITGMRLPAGRTALVQMPGEVFIIEKNAINNNILGLIMPS